LPAALPARQNAHMIRKLLLAAASIAAALVGTVAILYVLNAPPTVPTLSAADAAASSKPYVVKLHAQWCPYCILTKDEWRQIEAAYAGRVNLVVLDFTSEAATERSRAEAERLNLGPFFEEYVGATGIVVVLDGRTREVTAEIGGNRPLEDYRAAIDAALATTPG
jgi:thiol-disulfide isomerase/thioredoxin